MTSTLSLLGLYNYDGSILDGLTLPENFNSGDLETLKTNLLMETAELEILYTDPTFLKYSITQWCNKNKPTWKWLKDTQKYDYVPIWNADYHISDRTNREIGNVGTSHNLEEFNRGLYEDITSQKDYTRNLTESENTVDELTHGEVIDNTKNSTLTHGYNSSNATTYGSQEQTTYDTTDSEKHSNNDNTKAYTNRTQTTDHDIVNTGTETTTHNTFAYNDSSNGAPESSNVRDINGTNPLRSHESGIVDNFDNLEIGKTKTGTETTAHTGTDTTTHSGTDTDTLTETAKETHSGKDKREIDRDLTQAGGDSTHEASHDSQTGGTTTEDTGRTTSDTNDDTKYERYLRGNYGSTSTQSLIKEEQELAKFNLLDYIITDFKKRFCLMVY